MKTHTTLISVGLLAIFGASNSHGQNLPTLTARAMFKASELTGSPSVQIEKELEALFGKAGCALPEKLKKKLFRDNKAGFIPQDLRDALDKDLYAAAEKIEGASVRAALHSAEFKDADGKWRQILPTGPETYRELNPLAQINSQRDNFLYTMDCSGYLNSSLSLAGGVSASAVQTAATAALKAKTSIVAVRASLFSPIAMAMRPDGFPFELTRRQRADILYALVWEVITALPTAPEATEITSWREIGLMWTSNEGSSSFQGKSSVSGNAGIGAGIFSTSTGISAGGQIDRQVSFSKFNTYIVDSDSVTRFTATVGELRSVTLSLINNSFLKLSQKVNNNLELTFDMPRAPCNSQWRIREEATETDLSGSVTSQYSQDGCKFVVKLDAPLAANARGFRLVAPWSLGGGAISFVLRVPAV